MRRITDVGVTHRNHYEDIALGYMAAEYGFEIKIETDIKGTLLSDITCTDVMTETRWVSYDEDGAYTIWNTKWVSYNFGTYFRAISEKDITDEEDCIIMGMVENHLDTLERELLWSEEY